MTELPTCRWREEPTVQGHHKCSSRKLSHGPNGVLDSLCQGCYCRDHPPETPEQVENRNKQQEAIHDTVVMADIKDEQRQPFLGWLGSRVSQGLQMVRAYKKWWLAGCPRPTSEQLAEREETCHSCKHWDSNRDGCRKCGCGVGGGSLDAKRNMATEECPDSPPRWGSCI